MTRPTTVVPRFATDATFTTGPKSGQSTKVAMTSGGASGTAQGNVPEVPPDAQKFNWWMDLIAQWILYQDSIGPLNSISVKLDGDGVTKADPTSGYIRVNNATTASIDKIWVDIEDADGRNLSALYGAISTGEVLVVKPTDPDVWALFDIISSTDETGYYELTVSHVAGPGGWSDEDNLRLVIQRTPASGLPDPSAQPDGKFLKTLSGAFVFGDGNTSYTTITAPQLTANADEWNPTGFGAAQHVNASADTSRAITGMKPPAAGEPPVKFITVTSGTLSWINEAGGSTAEWRISGSRTLSAGATAAFGYDPTTERWRFMPLEGLIPHVTSSARGTLQNTSGASEGDLPAVQSDGTVDYVTPPGRAFSSGVLTASSGAYGNNFSHGFDLPTLWPSMPDDCAISAEVYWSSGVLSGVPDDADSDIAASQLLQITYNNGALIKVRYEDDEGGTPNGNTRSASEGFMTGTSLDTANTGKLSASTDGGDVTVKLQTPDDAEVTPMPNRAFATLVVYAVLPRDELVI